MTNMLFATALILISLGTAVSSQFIRRRQIDLTVPQVILKPQKTQKEPRRPPLLESDEHLALVGASLGGLAPPLGDLSGGGALLIRLGCRNWPF